MSRSLRRLLCAALAATVVTSAAGAAQTAAHHALWTVHGARNTVYLLGSVHLLETRDSTLPAEMLSAYQHADTLLMEVDPADIAGGTANEDVAPLTVLPEGRTLDSVIGRRLYAQVRLQAGRIGLGEDALKFAQPWYAANVIDIGMLMRSGFDPDAGVERQLARLAQRDGKPIHALETAGQQLGYFAAMPLARQKGFLRDTLHDLPATVREARATVLAWKHGDVAAMERDLHQMSRRNGDLPSALVDERNRNWLPQIVELLDDERDCLVVVGSLHMVGDSGLLRLLEARGYRISQQ